MIWQLRDRTLEPSRTPLVMGIVNVTPDSFSDGGQFADSAAAAEAGARMAAEGAAIVDVGGESTRPGAKPVRLPEDWASRFAHLRPARGSDITGR